VLQRETVQRLVRGGVLSSWMMYAAMEQSSGSPTAPIVGLVCTTVVTLRMLEWSAEVRVK